MRTFILALLIVSWWTQTPAKDFEIFTKELGSKSQLIKLGMIKFEMRGSNAVTHVSIQNQDLYDSMLKKAEKTFVFEFRPEKAKSKKLFWKSLLTIGEKTKSVGFQVYTGSDNQINAINAVRDLKIKEAFSVHVKPELNSNLFVGLSDSEAIGIDDDDEVNTIPGSATDGTTSRKEKRKNEEKKPWYKEYFWYLIIGGFFIMQLLSVDKEKLKENMDTAKEATAKK